MPSLFKALPALLLVGISVVFVLFQSAEAARIADRESSVSDAWYGRKAEGWHWYKDPVKEEIEELLPPAPPEEPKEEKKEERIVPLMTPTPASAQSKPEEPVAFSQAWLQKMIPIYLMNAVDNPTPENIEAFYVIQRIAMDKAERFARMAEQVRVGNRLIDETFRRPTSNFGLQDIDKEADRRTAELLAKVADFSGLFFFFKEGCPFCERQAPIIKELERKGFSVIAVSLDGGTLRSARFDRVVRDNGQAALLNVQATPAVFLANPKTGTIALLGESLMAQSELERRILLVAARNEWITQEELAQTRHESDPGNAVDLSKDLPQLVQALQEAEKNPQKFVDVLAMLEGRVARMERDRLSNLPDEEKRSIADENGFIDPKVLLRVMHGIHDKKAVNVVEDVPPSMLLFASDAPNDREVDAVGRSTTATDSTTTSGVVSLPSPGRDPLNTAPNALVGAP